MPPLTLEGDTLGEKRRHFNKLVARAIADKHYELCNIRADDSDVDNLLKIDIACKTRNVDFIMEVMKSTDMLYAATAIKKSTWLITEQQYAHIINPEYLHTQLLPSMNPKSFNKLMLHIRLNLKDETRVETFYEYLKETDSAYKWLQNCSIPFIENVIKNERLIPLSLFKRLCKRSAHFITYYKRVVDHICYKLNGSLLFLLKSHTELYLNFLDKSAPLCLSYIGKKRSEVLMKTCSSRIFKEFEKYADILDPSVVAKYLKKEEIKPFLLKKIKNLRHYFTEFEKLKHFVKNMPELEKQEFIRQTFIDRTDLTFLRSEDEEDFHEIDQQFYHWYEYVPFDVAFPELKKLILAENKPTERIGMLSVLIKCVRKNPQHIKTLLQFAKDRHVNEPHKVKHQFVNNLLSQISTHELDVETWNILDQLFYSMEVYSESEKNVQLCVQSIVLYKVLHDEPVPEIVERKMEIDKFERNLQILNEEQNDKIFTYLLNSLLTKIRSSNVANKSDFDDNLQHLTNVLNLLKDWKKDISCFPFVLEKIQELVNIKLQNSWEINSDIYNIKKSWRKHMFEESLSLSLCEETCLNALKHKPQLLARHDKEIDALRADDAVSLRRLLARLRVYWPHSLAQHWTQAYLLNLNKPTGQKAVIRGLFALLPQDQIIDLAKKHTPDNFKINWGEIDQTNVNTQKNIAKNLHVARPLFPIDTVLWYANGDYLQYAVPSLNAILSKLCTIDIHKYVLKFLEGPSSLQKLGLHLVISTFKPSEIKTRILNIWNSTTNPVLRTVIFKNTYSRICNVKNTTFEKELWTLFSMYFDKLTSRENKELYKYLGHIEKVPLSVRAEFYMRSYAYLTSLPHSDTRDKLVRDLGLYVRYNPELLESFNDDFVTDKLLSPAGTKFCMRDSFFINIFRHYVLWGKTEEDQLQRCRRVIEPAMEEVYLSWDKVYLGDYYVRSNFNKFIKYLISDVKTYTCSRKSTPTKLFTEIKINMEKNLNLKNYVMYTSWKLFTEYAKLLEQYIHITHGGETWLTDDEEKTWNEIHVAMYPALALQIVNCLKEDIKQYFPSICLLFSKAFNEVFDCTFYYGSQYKLEILKHMLYDPDNILSYIVVSQATSMAFYSKYIPDTSKRIRTEIRKKIKFHPSQEVQMHYFHNFKSKPFDEIKE